MARNYIAIPYEYMDEMACMDDETFGKMVRYLLAYGRDKKTPSLTGLEAVVFQRMKMQEDRFQESYDDLTNTRSTAGKAGAAKRWGKDFDGKNSKRIANDSKRMANDSKPLQTHGKNGNTETETETETNTPSTSVDNGVRRRSRFRPPTQEEVAAYCAERKNNVISSKFCDFYAANGWMVGKNHMKDWKAAVRNWERREKETPKRRETDNERYSRELQDMIASDGGDNFDPWRCG